MAYFNYFFFFFFIFFILSYMSYVFCITKHTGILSGKTGDTSCL